METADRSSRRCARRALSPDGDWIVTESRALRGTSTSNADPGAQLDRERISAAGGGRNAAAGARLGDDGEHDRRRVLDRNVSDRRADHESLGAGRAAVLARRPRPRRHARAHRLRAHTMGIQPRRVALHAESLARGDRDDLRRSAYLVWNLARLGRVAGWCGADRGRGWFRDRDVDGGWRGRARLLLMSVASSSIVPQTLMTGKTETGGCGDDFHAQGKEWSITDTPLSLFRRRSAAAVQWQWSHSMTARH